MRQPAMGDRKATAFSSFTDKKARFAGRRSAKRADLENAAFGRRRSAALHVQSLGGGVRLNTD